MGIKNHELYKVLFDFEEMKSRVLDFIRKHQMKNSDFKTHEIGKAGWYISDGKSHYLHKDLKLHRNTGYFDCGQLEHGNSPGYYPSKEIAEAYLQAYLNLEENQVEFKISKNCNGWFVSPTEKIDGEYYYLWKDLELHRASTGYDCEKHSGRLGSAPGYYSSKLQAEINLETFKEKHKMADKIEIDVKVNGVVTPLYKISEQSLLTVRENSKPKEVPVARMANYGVSRRLILKISDSVKQRINDGQEVIVIDLKYGNVTGFWSLESDQHNYNGANFYDNVKVL